MRGIDKYVCPKQGVPRKSQGVARDFWGRGETVPRRLRIAFGQTAVTRVLFRRSRAEENLRYPDQLQGSQKSQRAKALRDFWEEEERSAHASFAP